MTPVRWGMAAVPVGGRAWPDNESTRRAKLAARTARGRVATHRHTQRPGTTGVEGAGGPVGLAAVPVGGGRAWPDNEPTRRAKLAARTDRGRVATHRHTQRPGTTGVEGAGGSGGHGRASRSTTPSRQARVWRSRGRPGPTAPGTPVGPQATQAGRPPPTGTHSGGTDGARNTSVATDQATTRHRGAGPQARAPSATTQTRTLRSTCVRSRSARAARRWRRSSRSPRLRRRAGPRR